MAYFDFEHGCMVLKLDKLLLYIHGFFSVFMQRRNLLYLNNFKVVHVFWASILLHFITMFDVDMLETLNDFKF
jgi:hypothetical protein